MAALLLTGGSSRRMGRAKGSLPHVATLASLLEAVAPPAWEVGPGFTSLPVVTEADPGEGPLAAVAAALPALGGAGALVVACDLPLLDEPTLRWLASQPGTAIPVADGRPQPLCARWSAGDLGRAPALVALGRRAMAALYHGGIVWLDVDDPRPFADVDTPSDLERLGLVL